MTRDIRLADGSYRAGIDGAKTAWHKSWPVRLALAPWEALSSAQLTPENRASS